MSNDPARIPSSKVVTFLEDIGLDPVDPKTLKSFSIDSGQVTVVRYRQDENGDGYAASPHEAATETITMAVDVDA